MYVRCIKIILIIVLVIGIFPHTLFAQNTDLRGQVVTYNPYSDYFFPTSNIRVDLYTFDYQYQRWVIVRTAYTDPYGMYYMFNIIPGEYYLQVNRVNYPLTVVRIDRRVYQFQDIPRIELR